MYAKFFKRFFDFWLSLATLVILSPLLAFLAVAGSIAMKGSPFFFQLRPGMIDPKTEKEKLFKLIKFRTMNNEKDRQGVLLPDEKRLNAYGRLLRSYSLDELPELWNILKGDMAIVGPRPQLVKDLVFMTTSQRQRHRVRPGLTGLAQVNGRNNITWEQKFIYDLEYIEHVTMGQDIRIIFKTFAKVFSRSDVARNGTVSDIDYGDWLLQKGEITEAEYSEKQLEAERLLSLSILKR